MTSSLAPVRRDLRRIAELHRLSAGRCRLGEIELTSGDLQLLIALATVGLPLIEQDPAAIEHLEVELAGQGVATR